MAILRSLITVILLVLPLSTLGAPMVGDPAPDFSIKGSDGNSYSLSQFRGEKPVVIAFFPKAFTGG